MADNTAPLATSEGGVVKPSIVVHHLDDSRSQRILWLLEELQVPYEIKKYKRMPDKRAPKELLEVHPLGKSPVITDGGTTIAESGVIVLHTIFMNAAAEYLINKYGNGNVHIGSESEWLDNLYYTDYPEGSLMPVLSQRIMFRLIPQQMPFFLRPILRFVFGKIDAQVFAPDLKNNGEMIEAHLRGTKGWVTGGENPTSADYMLVFALQIFVEMAPEYSGPAIKGYIKLAQDRQAYKRALDRGGEYAFNFHD